MRNKVMYSAIAIVIAIILVIFIDKYFFNAPSSGKESTPSATARFVTATPSATLTILPTVLPSATFTTLPTVQPTKTATAKLEKPPIEEPTEEPTVTLTPTKTPTSVVTTIISVKDGDTLWGISEEYFGGGWHYRTLVKTTNQYAEDNPKLVRFIDDPWVIFPSDLLVIEH